MNIKEVTKFTGLTSKTLRHWESVGLLHPQRAKNDYRIYTDEDITKIFYILSLRTLDLPLAKIKKIMSLQINEKTALTEHLLLLTEKKEQLSVLIEHLSTKLKKGEYQMTEQDFEAFKEKQLTENEKNYGEEIRAKYGIKQIEKSNRQFLAQSKEDMNWAKETHQKIINMLEDAYANHDQKLAYEAVSLHKKWLEFYWSENTVLPEAHIALGQMYCDDDRFRANYTQKYQELPEFFRDCIIEFYNK